jgi:hypothetical protein
MAPYATAHYPAPPGIAAPVAAGPPPHLLLPQASSTMSARSTRHSRKVSFSCCHVHDQGRLCTTTCGTAGGHREGERRATAPRCQGQGHGEMLVAGPARLQEPVSPNRACCHVDPPSPAAAGSCGSAPVLLMRHRGTTTPAARQPPAPAGRWAPRPHHPLPARRRTGRARACPCRRACLGRRAAAGSRRQGSSRRGSIHNLQEGRSSLPRGPQAPAPAHGRHRGMRRRRRPVLRPPRAFRCRETPAGERPAIGDVLRVATAGRAW